MEDKWAMASTAVELSFMINCNVIFCLTETGTMARALAKFRPRAIIVAVG